MTTDAYHFPLYIKGRGEQREQAVGRLSIAAPINGLDLALVRQQIDNALAVVAKIEGHAPPPAPRPARNAAKAAPTKPKAAP